MYGKYCCPLLVIASRILHTIFNVNVTGYLSLFGQLTGSCVCSVHQVTRAGRVFALLRLPVLCYCHCSTDFIVSLCLNIAQAKTNK